jgi:hypothetical protein
MASLTDWQLGVVDEVTFGTPPVVTRFFEYESESIADDPRRTESDPLRVGGEGVIRNDRFTPYYGGASGEVSMSVLTKGFGFWLKHMLGTEVTTGPTETSVYTHVGTLGTLQGDMFTMQVNRPFNPSGTAQAITYSGGKIPEWTLSNSAEENLMLSLTCDFAAQTTGTALATASYPTGMENFTWAGATISIGGAAYDVTEFSVTCNNGMNLDRRQLRGNTMKKEPTTGRREVSWSLSADFDTLANRNRALSNTRAGALAVISAVWLGPTLLGTTIYPTVQVDIPAGRSDAWSGATEGPDAISQTLSGVGRYDGTNSALSVTYKSADITA